MLYGSIEKAPPPIRRAFDEPQIVWREGDDRDPAKKLVRIAHRFAIEARRPAAVADRHLDLALARVDRERSAQMRLFCVDAHQLGELLRPQGAERAEEVASLEEVRLALPVRSEQHRGVRAERDALGREVPEVARLDFAQEQRPTPSRRDRSERRHPGSCIGSGAGNAGPAFSSLPPVAQRQSLDAISRSRLPPLHRHAARGKKRLHRALRQRRRHQEPEPSSREAAVSPGSCRAASTEERRTRRAAPDRARRPA